MKIAIVTDSTSMLKEDKDLFIVPLSVMVEEETFFDNDDVNEDEFFKVLKSSENITTSQPPIGIVEALFSNLLESYDKVLYITISSGISGTYSSGFIAKGENENIFVYDSFLTSVALKNMVLKALSMKETHSIEEIIKELDKMRETNIYLAVDDLSFLMRSGRVNKTEATLGNMFKVKPILQFEKGKIELDKKVRGRNKVINYLLDMIKEHDITKDDFIMIAYSSGYDYALDLKNKIVEKYPDFIIEMERLSFVISVHTGPETIGLCFYKEKSC